MDVKSNNPFLLTFAADVLTEAGVDFVMFDTHMSVMDGSMAMVPRRLMVLDEDHDRAEMLLRAAVPRSYAVIAEAETFLGGRVRIEQPESGFRSGLDAVMLAAAVPAQPGDTALELGAGRALHRGSAGARAVQM